MKNLFIILLVVLAAGCTQDTSELKNNVLKAYNSDAPQGAKATDLMIIQKKGNEYVGLLTTENDMQLMLSVFSDGNEFFYWVTNGAIWPGNQQITGVTEEEVSMENFPKDLIGTWSINCDQLETNPFETYSITFDEDGVGGVEFHADIIDISGANGEYKLKVNIINIYTNEIDSEEIWALKIEGNKLFMDNTTLYKCPNN